MRLLFVHADHLEFETTTEAGEGVGETEGVPTAGRMEDCVTAFVTVESGDEADLDAAVENAADELRSVADRLNTRKVVLYPCDHLSDDLAEAESATTALRGLETALEADHEVLRAPVGWYMAFELSCKGHPFSELSRRVTPERGREDGATPDRAASEWKLLFPDGEARDLRDPSDDLDAEDPSDALDADRVTAEMRAFIEAKVEGRTANEGERPLPVDLMGEKEIGDYDGSSDGGSPRWYPRGKLIRDSVAEYANDLAVEYGAMPVETTGASGREANAGRAPTDRVGEGRLSIMRDADIAERDLPLRLYETPEMHTACADLEGAREELRAQAELALRTGEDFGLDYRPAIRMTRDFHEENETWVGDLVADLDRPALVEILPERRREWAVEVEFATVDRRASPFENPTVRIDVESAERFGVAYADGEERHHPPIVHCSPSGSIEHAVAALLETASKRDAPRLPTWLSPTQVRFVPVDEEHVEYCDALAADLEGADIRADVDDRDETVGKRIARAESDWVPYFAVVGDRELESEGDALAVNVRTEGRERDLTLAELRETVLDDVSDLPKKRRYLPRRVSGRPQFSEP